MRRVATAARQRPNGRTPPHRPLDANRPGGRPSTVDGLIDVQRTAGNQALGELLGADAGAVSDVGLRSSVAEAPAPPAPPGQPDGGQPLEPGMRRRMEDCFGTDFSSVRVHAGPAASTVAAREAASAFSVGQDIVFGRRFDPASSEGQSLLTHELAHVVQQTEPRRAGDGASGAEAEADAAVGTPDGSQFAVQRAAPVGIQRAPEWWTAAKAKAGAYVDKGAETVDAALDKASEKLADAAQTVADVTHEATTVIKDAYGAAKETAAEVKTAVVETARDAKAAVVEKAREVKAKAAAAVRVAKAKTAEAGAAITSVANTVNEKTATAAGDVWKRAKRKAGDRVMRSAGQAKGVLLEVTNLVDSVLWLDYQGRKWAQRGVEKGLDWAEKKQWISKEAHQVAGAVYGEEFGTAKADRLRDAGVLKFDTDAAGKELEWGGPSITASVSPALDRYADMLGTAVGATPESEVTFFTEYEVGEVEGAVGTQVALAFVGVEEVQLVLKGLGAIGGGKGLILSIERGDDWGTIGVNALNLVLAVIGLAKGKAAQKIVAVASKLGALAGMYPPLKQLYAAYKSPKETTDPAAYRRELAAAAGGVIKAGQAVVQSIIHARPGKTGAAPAEESAGGGKAPSPTPSEGPVAPTGTTTEAQPATAAPKTTVQPPPEVVAPTPKPVVPQLETAGGEGTVPKPPVPVVTEGPPPVVKQPPAPVATETTTPASNAPPPVQTETPPPVAKTPPVQTETPPPFTKTPPIETETPPPTTKAAPPTELEGPPPASKATETPDATPAPAAAKAPPESEVAAPAARSLAATKAARTRADSLISEAKSAPPPTAAERASQRAAFEAALEQTAYPNDRKATLRAAFEAAIEPTPPAQQQAKIAVGQDFEPEPEQPPKPPLQLVPSPETGSTPTVASAGRGGGTKPPPPPTKLAPSTGPSVGPAPSKTLPPKPPSTAGTGKVVPMKPKAPSPSSAEKAPAATGKPTDRGAPKAAAPAPKVPPAVQLEALEARAERTLQGHPDADRVAKLVVEANRLAKDPSKAAEAAAAVAKVRSAIEELEGAPVRATGSEDFEGEPPGLRINVVWEPPPGARPRPPDTAPAAIRTDWLRERLQQHVDAAKARYEEAGLTPRQEAAAQEDPGAFARFRGSRIDEYAKSSVLQDPELARVITAPDFIREPDFIDASMPSWFDITTREAWAAHLRKYSATHGTGELLPTNPK